MANKDIHAITTHIVNETLNLLSDRVDKIILYGSYAKGTPTAESDIDIMILLNCDKHEVKRYRKSVSRLSSRIGLKNDIEVSLTLRDKKSFYDNLNILPFYQNVDMEGVSLYEQQFKRLI